ncbi:MAG TPA: hypothetical protein GXX28_07340, partial [Firmicutes bacterium]|nr:hypothetical protein [Bacillota bacterium]
EAERILRPRLAARLRLPVRLECAGEERTVLLAEIGAMVDWPATLAAAYAPGHRGPWPERWRAWRRAWHGGLPLRAAVRWDERVFRPWLEGLRRQYGRPPVEAGWRVRPDESVEVIPGAVGRDVQADVLRRRLQAVAFASLPRRRVALPLHTVYPRRTTDDALALGIEGVVAGYRTYFNAADADRSENVRLAAAAIDQVVLQPGELFSFNRQVGPRVPSSGYREAPVVVGGRLVPGVGGGVCQVSSTLYNAALLAELEMVTRHRHSIPSAYVPPGRDATVAFDYFDLRFRNTRDHPVVIDTEVGPGWLHVRVLGRRRPEERVEVVSRILETYPPEVEEIPDPTLPAGQRLRVVQGSPGYRVKVWRVIYRSGVEVQRQLVSDDRYQPLDALIRIGTGPAAPLTPQMR